MKPINVGPGAVYKSVNASDAEIWGGELSSTYYLNEAKYGTSFLSTLAFAQGDNTTTNEPLETCLLYTSDAADD